ncbi:MULTISPECIES: group III truncated hemoglobin [Rhodanobacter]|jgi:hemoglobin|uniref:Hemoglobin n=1 Tax=Rhodanobacter glycinis TaxID=582702 RepID=A0A1I3ZQ29_9GAMM|nr:group III truncated hemoglobin [Rhodanobacter glycinis]QEE25780.1 group III truncated hemoglobin [Rhodanobacter glycinis]SFK46087.1 hemoglobin [Rhodanobacter glycinis]
MNTATTLDESRIANLVDRFYDKVQADPSIGPIFNAAVHDWPEHKRLLTSFWCSVALRAASYRGNPMSVHRAQPSIRTEHFVRWLELWRETTLEVLDENDAAQMLDYAERIGRSLRMGMGLPDRLDARPLGIPVVGLGKP